MATAAEFSLLRDGGQILLRPLEERDRPRVEALFQRLSPESRSLRFHSGGVRVDPHLVAAATAGHAIVGEVDGQIVALASYNRLRDPYRAEMAIVVDDAHQGRGIGTVVFERLSRDARQQGIRRLLAIVMATNTRMLTLLQHLGFRVRRRFEGGDFEVDIDLRPDPSYVASADARMHVAAIASLEPIFRPRAIAVVGASREHGTVGHELFRNLIAGGFPGPVYPVNPEARAIASVRAYPSIGDVPDQVDLAVIAVPAVSVVAAARECLDAGVRGLVVVSAGFAEIGGEGRKRQDELARLCRSHGARLVGPNCMGVLVNGPAGTMNATFTSTLPPPGKVAVVSQSGALGIAILDHARQLGIGISAFVSVGNKADLSSNDLIERWEDDPATDVILLYLESFGNPRRFARLARRVSARKPIVAVKGGRSQAGRRAAASHTAALAGSDAAVDALFRQAGVIRCDTLEELFDVAALLANQPVPAGNRVAVITNAGGPGTLCADACEANGLCLPELAELTRAALRSILQPEASVANPVDMLSSASAANYGEALRHVLTDPSVDAVIVLFVPPLVTAAGDVAAALAAACDSPPAKPILACFVGAPGMPACLHGKAVIPSYTFPEAAARALGHAAAYGAWLRRPAGHVPAFDDVDLDPARTVVETALALEEAPWLRPDEVGAVLEAYGVQMAKGILVSSPEEAADVECLIGVVTDPIFGPLIAFGLGGVMAEVVGDVAFRVSPLTDLDADELIASVKASKLLRGYRGSAPADIPALRDLLLRIARLVEDVPEVAELDINPVIVREAGGGAIALDARLRLRRPSLTR